MRYSILLPLVLSTSIAGAVHALELKRGAVLGTSFQEIESTLSDDGYELTAFDKRATLIKVHAVRDGIRHVLFLDAITGEVKRAPNLVRQAPSALPTVGQAPAVPAVIADDDIRARLQAEGYRIIKIEREPGETEVYAMRDGRQWELKIDPGTGQTLRVEAED